MILKYRVPAAPTIGAASRPASLQDAQRAVSLVRSNAAQWGIDPRQIGIAGFSAGGHLAIATATSFEHRADKPVDDIDRTIADRTLPFWRTPDTSRPRTKTSWLRGYTFRPGRPPSSWCTAGPAIISDPAHSVVMYLALKRAGVTRSCTSTPRPPTTSASA